MALREYQAVRCALPKCSVFQVITKPKGKQRFQCRICREKQSIRKIYAKANTAREVRPIVQDLNMRRADEDRMKAFTRLQDIRNEETNHCEDFRRSEKVEDGASVRRSDVPFEVAKKKRVSKWAQYEIELENQVPQSLDHQSTEFSPKRWDGHDEHPSESDEDDGYGDMLARKRIREQQARYRNRKPGGFYGRNKRYGSQGGVQAKRTGAKVIAVHAQSKRRLVQQEQQSLKNANQDLPPRLAATLDTLAKEKKNLLPFHMPHDSHPKVKEISESTTPSWNAKKGLEPFLVPTHEKETVGKSSKWNQYLPEKKKDSPFSFLGGNSSSSSSEDDKNGTFVF